MIIIRDRPNEPVDSMTFLFAHNNDDPGGSAETDAFLVNGIMTIRAIP